MFKCKISKVVKGILLVAFCAYLLFIFTVGILEFAPVVFDWIATYGPNWLIAFAFPLLILLLAGALSWLTPDKDWDDWLSILLKLMVVAAIVIAIIAFFWWTTRL